MLQHLAHGQPVAASADEHPFRVRLHAEGGMHQGLVVPVLVRRGELQVAVEEELEAPPAAGEHDALVGTVPGVDDLVGEDLLLQHQREFPGEHQPHRQQGHDRQAAQADQPRGAQLGGQQVGAPQAHDGVQEAEEEAGAHQAQLGHEEEGEEDAGEEGAHVVEGEHPRDEVLEAHLVLEDPHENGDLQAHQRAHHHHHAVEHHAECVGVGEGLEEDGRGEPAHQRDAQFQVHEAPCQAPLEELREIGTQAHGAEVDPDHRGELRDRVPQQVTRQRAGHQLVDQPAAGDEQHADEQQRRLQGLCGRLRAGITHGSRRR